MDLEKLYRELWDSMYGMENPCKDFITNLTDDEVAIEDQKNNPMNVDVEETPVNLTDEILENDRQRSYALSSDGQSTNNTEQPMIEDDATTSSDGRRLVIDGVTTTSSDTESFPIDGVTYVQNLDGVTTTSSVTESFPIDGVTSSDVLNLDGVTTTSSDTEPFIIHGVTKTESDDNDVDLWKRKDTFLNSRMMSLYNDDYAPDLYESDEYE